MANNNNNNNNNLTCPPKNTMPADVPLLIPDNLHYVIRAGGNTSDPAMAACCAPHRVNSLEGCYLWCEYPTRFSNESLTEFQTCLRSHDAEEGQSLYGNLPDSGAAAPSTLAARAPSLGALGFVVLLLGVLL